MTIYTICEHAANIIESVILFGYMILALRFKSDNYKTRIIGSAVFFLLVAVNNFVWNAWNQLMNMELIYAACYFLILLIFGLTMLKGKWWHQVSLLLIAFVCTFLINLMVITISSILITGSYSEILLMRNPTRIFLLAVTKALLFLMLMPISYFVQKRKFILSGVQYVMSIISFVIMMIAGISLEKLILDVSVSTKFATIIMCCIAAISILLFGILILFAIHNQVIRKQVALETRLRDDEIKLKETLQWSQSVRVLRHDLSNHLISIARYIENGEHQKALQYIEKISQKMDAIPHYMNTNSQTVNAMLDLKRLVCQNESIDLKCYVEETFPNFDEAAFCTIFGNLIDNAIEAERNEPVKSIRLALETASDYLHITVQNRIHQSVLIDGNLPRTTKSDAEHHGLGLQSVMETVEQMSGAMHIREQDGWFLADVLMPCTEKNES